MVHIYNSYDSEALTEELENQIKSNWKNPFVPPVVLFSDSKIEQWFKINWIKKNQKNYPVLMNLEGKRLESFLFSVIDYEDGIKPEHLSCELLRDIIIQKLLSQQEGTPDKFYFETLNDIHLNQYLFKTDENGNKTVDELHLFDLADSLSDIFYTYECTRGDKFIEAWLNGKDFFTGENTMEIQKWQRQIYKDTFEVKNYLNLPRLSYYNRRKNGFLKTSIDENSGIYVFGFNGMGEAYREALEEIGKNQEVYIFVQGQNFNQREEDGYKALKNPLLKKWGQSGFENLLLWSKKGEVNQVPFAAKPPCLLGTIQNKICNDEEIKAEDLEKLAGDGTICFADAASKVREVEYVHSEICKIIQEKNGKKEPVEFSDFVVLSPSIEEYKVPVLQVFGQNSKENLSEEKDSFPQIPYIFADYSANQSFTAAALEILFGMLKKKSLSRKDLFDLVQNPVVQAARGFSSEEVSFWAQWVNDLNAYRDRPAVAEDWKTALKRLLLSRLTENEVVAGEEKLIPYANINTEDNETLLHFANVIEELENWIESYGSKKQLSSEDVGSIRNFMDKWLCMQGQVPFELSGERTAYSEIAKTFNYQKTIFDMGVQSVNGEGFYSSLEANCKSSTGSNNMLFTGGITFSRFISNRIIPAKYVFIIGLDSKIFPGIDRQSSLDLRSYVPRLLGDEIPSAKNKDAFLCQLMAAKEKLFISYVSKDLKKSEEFFYSSVVNNLFECIFTKFGKKDFEVTSEAVLNIDETRGWQELFTKREFRNRSNHEAMLKAKPGDSSGKNETETAALLNSERSEEEIRKTLPDRVYLSELKSFLKNPFLFQIKKILNANEDDDKGSDKNIEFEPLELDALQNSALITENVLENKDLSEKFQINREEIYSRHILDKNDYGEISMASVEKTIEYFRKAILQNQGNVIKDFIFKENLSFRITQKIQLKNGSEFEKSWLLCGTACGYRWSEENLELMDFTSAKESGLKHALSSYISALYLIAREKTEKSYGIKINIYSGKGDYRQINLKKMNSENALKILKELYEKAFFEKFKSMIFINWLGTDKEQLSGIRAFVEKANGEADWEYFSKRKYINLYKDAGYTSFDFEEKFPAVVEIWKRLFPLAEEQ